MVQLTLMEGHGSGTFADALSAVSGRWSARLGDGAHLVVAAEATCRRFAGWKGRELTERERARVSAYYGAVARRAALRARDRNGVAARRRLVAATIEADLLEAGWPIEQASAEVLRVMGNAQLNGGAA